MAKDLELEKTSPEASEDGARDSKADKKAKSDKGKGAKNRKKPKRGVVKYFKDARSEFKKVVWPTPKDTTRNTAVVIITCAIAALFVFGLDSLFGFLNGLLFR